MDAIGDSLKCTLDILKNWIGVNASKWEIFKSRLNSYENVYTVQPMVYNGLHERKHPVSRAFYKLWEIVSSDNDIMTFLSDPASKTVAYVAEAPGSFIECIVTVRRIMVPNPVDEHVSITLIPNRRSVPYWKLHHGWMSENNVKLTHGADGSGDIYKPENIQSFVTSCGGERSCDFVTADGGFDFSSDFNKQEEQMLRLLTCEFCIIMRVLKPGGTTIIKIFDAFTKETREVIAFFMSRFEQHYITKPFTSRPANSERYLVCKGYIPSEDATATMQHKVIDMAAPIGAPDSLIAQVIDKNTEMVSLQINYIIRVFDAIRTNRHPDIPDKSGDWYRKFVIENTFNRRFEERKPA